MAAATHSKCVSLGSMGSSPFLPTTTMQEPIKPWPPTDYHLDVDDEEVVVYWFREILNDDLDEEYIEEDCEESGYTKPDKTIHQITLADIIAMLPEGVTPDQVQFRTEWPRMMEWIDYRYVYVKKVDKKAIRAKYKQDMAKYNLAAAKYKKDKAAFDEWKKGQDIQRLELELNKLKGK